MGIIVTLGLADRTYLHVVEETTQDGQCRPRKCDGFGQPFPETHGRTDLRIGRQLLELWLRSVTQNIHDVCPAYPFGVIEPGLVVPTLLELLDARLAISHHRSEERRVGSDGRRRG